MNKTRPKISVLLLLSIYFLSSCTGPRNIYSASPFVSPVALTKGASAIHAEYFAHSRQPNIPAKGNHDNCFGLTISHMLTNKMLLFANADVNKERNIFHDSIPLPNDRGFNAYNAGFDSSVVSANRHSFEAGIEFFPSKKRTNTSFALSAGLHHLNMKESGILHQTPYIRFYNVNQASVSWQQNFLFKIKSNLNLAWVVRITALWNFAADTDYSSDEKTNAGLQDRNVNAFLGMTGFYADYKPFEKIPLYVTGQFFNDLASWTHGFAHWEPGRTYIKGTGVSTGLKYIF